MQLIFLQRSESDEAKFSIRIQHVTIFVAATCRWAACLPATLGSSPPPPARTSPGPGKLWGGQGRPPHWSWGAVDFHRSEILQAYFLRQFHLGCVSLFTSNVFFKIFSAVSPEFPFLYVPKSTTTTIRLQRLVFFSWNSNRSWWVSTDFKYFILILSWKFWWKKCFKKYLYSVYSS